MTKTKKIEENLSDRAGFKPGITYDHSFLFLFPESQWTLVCRWQYRYMDTVIAAI